MKMPPIDQTAILNKETSDRKSPGRPSKYKDTYPQELVELMSNGALNCHIYAKWNIHKDTFYQWMYDHPEFKEAYEIGKPKCEAWWVDWGMRGMQGQIKGFNFNAWIAFMNNKFSWVPGNKQPQDNSNQTINIGNLNVLQNQSGQQLIDTIQRLALKHPEALEIEYTEVKNDPENKS